MKLFITGIGTDIGKSWATGWLANKFVAEGKTVITQKFIQTGNQEMSEDIELHRRIMGIPFQEVDLKHITCPVIFSYPASPHLAAAIDGREIDFKLIGECSKKLQQLYDVLLIEGAGGIMVPLKDEYLTIDYVCEEKIPVVLVTNGRLGSISDTLLALEAIERRNMQLYAVIYNPYFDTDPKIAQDSKEYMRNRVTTHFPNTEWMEMDDSVL